MNITNKRDDQIWESLRDPEFRKQFIDEGIAVGIAFQIRALRNRRNLRQAQLAKLLDVKQPLISSWEDPSYGKYSLATLKDLAKAFDVGLLVRFVPFGKLVDLATDLTTDVIAPLNFNEEQSRKTVKAFLDRLELDANRAYPSEPSMDANQSQFVTEGAPNRA